jgi:hypothetical protein
MAVATGSSAVRAHPDELDEYPVDSVNARYDARYAQMAVVIHQGEDWPSGRLCRNCHAPFPCRLARWGVRVLVAAGWTSRDMALLVSRAKAGVVPWL